VLLHPASGVGMGGCVRHHGTVGIPEGGYAPAWWAAVDCGRVSSHSSRSERFHATALRPMLMDCGKSPRFMSMYMVALDFFTKTMTSVKRKS